MQYRLGTLLILMVLVSPALVAIWFVADSILEMVGWSVLPMVFALAYWWIRERQMTTRGYGWYGTDTGSTGGE